MPVTEATSSMDDLSVVITSRFDAPVERVWQVWSDPRQLERWWGPPTYPATVTEHELRPGGAVRYYMTSPEGQRFGGWWQIEEVDEPTRLVFQDGFADSEGKPLPDLPVSRSTMTLTQEGDGTRMTVTTTYTTADDLQKVLDMGMLEGATEAGNQIDGLLAA